EVLMRNDISDIYKLSDYESTESILLTMDLRKHATFGIELNHVISCLDIIMSKSFDKVYKIVIYSRDSNIKHDHYRILIIFKIDSVKDKVKKRLIDKISGKDAKKRSIRKMQKT